VGRLPECLTAPSVFASRATCLASWRGKSEFNDFAVGFSLSENLSLKSVNLHLALPPRIFWQARFQACLLQKSHRIKAVLYSDLREQQPTLPIGFNEQTIAPDDDMRRILFRVGNLNQLRWSENADFNHDFVQLVNLQRREARVAKSGVQSRFNRRLNERLDRVGDADATAKHFLFLNLLVKRHEDTARLFQNFVNFRWWRNDLV